MMEITELRYRHLAIIDHMLANPNLNQGAIAAQLGYTPAWLGTLKRSDLFKEEFARRRAEWEGELIQTAQAKIFDLADKSAEVLLNHLDQEKPDPQIALDVQKLALQSIGMGPTKESRDPAVIIDQSQTVVLSAPRDRVEKARERILNGRPNPNEGERAALGSPDEKLAESA